MRKLMQLGFAFLAVLALVAVPAFAQSNNGDVNGSADMPNNSVITGPMSSYAPPPLPRTFGPSPNYGLVSWVAVAIPASAFSPRFSNVSGGAASATRTYFYQASNGASNVLGFWAPINLPSGALLQYVDLQYYDNNAAAQVYYDVADQAYGNNDATFPQSLLSSGNAAVPGYGYMRNSSALNYTMPNNYTHSLVLYAGMTSSVTDTSLQIGGATLWYLLQISPAPATPTFVDVPNDGSIFYQSVQALSASGITAGCDATHYCPNNSVTRLQMAVFFARALGIHWPN